MQGDFSLKERFESLQVFFQSFKESFYLTGSVVNK